MKLRNYWSEDEDTLLRKLWKMNLSSSIIAERMGRNRGSITGRVTRLGIVRKGMSDERRSFKARNATITNPYPHTGGGNDGGNQGQGETR